jgi:hypothetical protein
MIFCADGTGPFVSEIPGWFENPTAHCALNVVHGLRVGDIDRAVGHQGAIAARGAIFAADHDAYRYQLGEWPGADVYRAVYCEYENAYGDAFRVEVPLLDMRVDVKDREEKSPRNTAAAYSTTINVAAVRLDRDRFFVQAGGPKNPKWHEIGRAPSVKPMPPPSKCSPS